MVSVGKTATVASERAGQQVRLAPAFWPKQWLAMQLLGLLPGGPCDGGPYVEQLLFGGSAGGGKSWVLRQIAYAACSRWPGAEVRLFRRTFPELDEYLIPRAKEELPAGMATYNSAQHEFAFPNGSRLRFLHANCDDDVKQYNTAEWAALLIDQAEDFTEYQLRFLSHRVRQPEGAFGGDWHRLIVLSANPGGVSHGYLRTRFIDPHPAGGVIFEAPEAEGRWRRYFLPSRLADNPSLNAQEYRRTLTGLPAHLVEAYLNGDWSAVVGAFFSQWRACDLDGEPWHVWPLERLRERYGVPARHPRTGQAQPFPPLEWTRWGAVDGGVRDPWVWLSAARAPDGRVIIYREVASSGVQVPDQAKRIRRTLLETGERPAALLCDPSMVFTPRANLNVTDAQVYHRHGISLTAGTNARVPGWRRVSELLSGVLDDGYPALVVVEGACPELVRTLPYLMAAPLDREDIDQRHGRIDLRDNPDGIRDDPADALRYLCMPAAAGEQRIRRRPLQAQLDPRADPDEPADDEALNRSGHESDW